MIIIIIHDFSVSPILKVVHNYDYDDLFRGIAFILLQATYAARLLVKYC